MAVLGYINYDRLGYPKRKVEFPNLSDALPALEQSNKKWEICIIRGFDVFTP